MGFLKRWIFGQSVPKNSKKEQQQTKKASVTRRML